MQQRHCGHDLRNGTLIRAPDLLQATDLSIQNGFFRDTEANGRRTEESKLKLRPNTVRVWRFTFPRAMAERYHKFRFQNSTLVLTLFSYDTAEHPKALRRSLGIVRSHTKSFHRWLPEETARSSPLLLPKNFQNIQPVDASMIHIKSPVQVGTGDAARGAYFS